MKELELTQESTIRNFICRVDKVFKRVYFLENLVNEKYSMTQKARVWQFKHRIFHKMT